MIKFQIEATEENNSKMTTLHSDKEIPHDKTTPDSEEDEE